MRPVASAFRSLRRAPGLSLTIVGLLAIGIGITTAIFSVVYALLLRPLPYKAADRIDFIRMSLAATLNRPSLSGKELLFLRDRSQIYEEFAAAYSVNDPLTTDGPPEQIDVGIMTSNLMPMLGTTPVIGRNVTAEEDAPTGARVALISYGLWQRRYGGDASVLGRSMILGGISYQIIGVLPRSFALYSPADGNLGPNISVWRPFRVDFRADTINMHYLRVVARRKAGRTTAQGQEELSRLATAFMAERGGLGGLKLGFSATSLQSEIVGAARRPILALMMAVAFVLLIACANVASLLLARNARRRRDVVLRVALGAPRGRIFAEVIMESLLLSTIGALLGILIAGVSLMALLALARHTLPMDDAVGLSWPAVLFATGLAIVTGLAFGLVPAFGAFPRSLTGVLAEGGRAGLGRAGKRIRSALIIGEVAFALLLLVGAALFTQSFRNASRVSLGFDPRNVWTGRIALPASRYDSAAYFRFLNVALQRIAAIPGVEAAGATSHLPLAGRFYGIPFAYDDQTAKDFGKLQGEQHSVTPGYLEAIGTKVLRGRSYSWSDIGQTDQVIIDDALAKRAYGDRDPIGQRLYIATPGTAPHWVHVLGVVEHVRHERITTPGREQVYLLQTIQPFGQMSFAIRGKTPPAQLTKEVTTIVHDLDPQMPVYEVKLSEDYVLNAMATTRLEVGLMILLSTVAMLLAAAGIYGLVSFMVEERMREFGIRGALGANPATIRGIVFHFVATNALIGTLIGVGAAYAMATAAGSLFYDVNTKSIEVFLLCAGAIMLASCAAAIFPAFRAAAVDPLVALRTT